MDDAITYN